MRRILSKKSAVPARSSLSVNIISTGNQYSTSAYSNANLDILFPLLKSLKFSQISIRVIWQIMEPTQGNYNATAISNMNRIYTKADQYGLNAMLDFHTLFNAADTGWQAPTWLTNITNNLTINNEIVSAGTMKHIFYTQAARDAFSNMQVYVAGQVISHPCIKYISMLNEPYLRFDSSTNNDYFEPAVTQLISGLSTYSKPLGCRQLSTWNPWCGEAKKQLGVHIWQNFGFIGINSYVPDPTDDNFQKEGTLVWQMLSAASIATHGAGKKLLITECGFNTGTMADYKFKWQYMFDHRYNVFMPDIIQMWKCQNDGDYFTDPSNTYNIMSGINQVADYVSANVTPNVS